MGVEPPTNLKVWSLRGKCNDLSIILEALQERLTNRPLVLLSIPYTKDLQGEMIGNSAGDIGTLMNEVELIDGRQVPWIRSGLLLKRQPN